MSEPEGSLTPAQFDILQLLWSTDAGMTVAEIWEATGQPRGISRTTTLNLVDRLEKRGWLQRKKVEGVYRYSPAAERSSTQSRIASDFVGDFFGGSPSQFLLSLLGSRRISKQELERLKELLDSPAKSARQSKKRG